MGLQYTWLVLRVAELDFIPVFIKTNQENSEIFSSAQRSEEKKPLWIL